MTFIEMIRSVGDAQPSGLTDTSITTPVSITIIHHLTIYSTKRKAQPDELI